MAIFDEGYCDNDDCVNGQVPHLFWNYKKEDYVADGTRECHTCMGTGRKLTAMGRELIEFLREAKWNG